MRSVLFAVSAAALLAAGCSVCGKTPEPTAEGDWTKVPAVAPIMKVGRGVANVVLSPVDIPMTVARRWKDADNFLGYTSAVVVGLGEGVCNGGARLGMGALEILSFPLYKQTEPYYEKDLGESVFGAGKKEPDEGG